MYRIRTGRHPARAPEPPARRRITGTFLLLCFFGFVYGIVVPKVGADAPQSTRATTVSAAAR